MSYPCGRCAWCLRDLTHYPRGHEKTCQHGYGCCDNCTACKQSPKKQD